MSLKQELKRPRVTMLAAIGALAVGALTSSTVSAQGVCLEQSVDEIVACDSVGVPQGGIQRRSGGASAPRSELRTAVPEAAASEGGTPAPSFEIGAGARTGRAGEIRARQFELLQREAELLKRQVQRRRANDPQRPEILLRLAETYFEMQQTITARVRSFDEPIYQACTVQENERDCQRQRQGQQEAEGQLDEARTEAIQAYAILVRDHPTFPRMDEVLFSLAFGLEEMRRHDQARDVYYRLIKSYPDSRFIPHAWLSFAEFYFNEGDMGAAVRFFGQVTAIPPERNPVYGYALYKSAWAYYNDENYEGSLRSFVETIEFATQNPDATDAANLASSARRELIMPYAQVGTPRQALRFFERYAENREQALDMLERLGDVYFDTGQWESTIAVFHQLMAEAPNSDKFCHWQSKVTNAIISSQPKAAQVEELANMVRVYDTFREQSHSEESQNECKTETATVLVWLATSWHREAVGTDDAPGTNDQSTMQLASRLYDLLISRFPDLEELEFPSINREDWPTLYRIAYYAAELKWKRENWRECGPAFDRVVELDPAGEYTSEAAYAAVLCYNNLYQTEYQARERATREAQARDSRRRGRRGRRGRQQEEEEPAENEYAIRELDDLSQGMVRAFKRYICFVNDSDDLPQIKYRLARIYYENNHFEEAAALFRDIAWNHRTGEHAELAEFAANLYLDSLNVLGTMREPANTQCLNELEESIDPLFEMFSCDGSGLDEYPDLCGSLQTLRCNVMRKQAEAAGRAEHHREAAGIYRDIFVNHQECGEQENFRMDEVLWNMTIHYQAARLLGRAIRGRQYLIENFPDSPLASRAIFLIGANYHALAYYERAAEFYERFARQFPGEDGSSCSDEDRRNETCAVAHEALQNAVLFRLGLGDIDAARSDVNLFESNYRRRLPTETAEVNYALGTAYEHAEDWIHVARHFREFLRTYRRTAPPHRIIQANVLLGRANLAMEADGSTRYFADAVSAWRNTPEAINRMEASDQQKIGYLKEGLDATAEALFYLAEVKYAEFRAIPFPRYRGSAALSRVTRWVETDFTPWITQKLAAAQAAEAEYNKTAELQVQVTAEVTYQNAPWQIAAASRIGQMYISIIDQTMDAPVPEEIARDDELYDIYVGSFDQQTQPIRELAMQKFQFCLTTATNVRWFNEYSAICESELNRLDPRSYPTATELRGEPTFEFGGLGAPGVVELGNTDDEATLSTSEAGDATE